MPVPHDPETLLRLALAGGPQALRRRAREAGVSAGIAVVDPAALERARAWLAQPGHHLLGWGDPDYPPLLARGANPPVALFVAGDPARLWHPAVAVVGSRRPTSGGRAHAARFAGAFARSGLCVASGLAAGIDTAAHEAALDAGGLTVAVVGTGPDLAFPRANARLMARIAERGAVVSEHPPGTGPRPAHFPSRNRILAALSLGTLVVEAAQRSGALITARLAAECGREVFALPGSIDNPMARGCHRLLRDGAALAETPEEVAAALVPVAAGLADCLRGRLQDAAAAPAAVVAASARPPGDGGPDYQRLWQALGHDPTCMEDLVSRTRLTAAELSSMLLVMELEGRVASAHGRYTRKS